MLGNLFFGGVEYAHALLISHRHQAGLCGPGCCANLTAAAAGNLAHHHRGSQRALGAIVRTFQFFLIEETRELFPMPSQALR